MMSTPITRTCFAILRTKAIWFGILVGLSTTPSLWGGMILRMESTSIIEGRDGFVNVFISSDAADTITDASFEFRITPLGGIPRRLRFADPQSDGQLSDPDYLFSTASFRRDGVPDPDPLFAFPPSPVGEVSSELSSNDTFIGFDFDPTLIGVATGTDEFLLARLNIQPGAGLLAAVAGDRFQLDLVPSADTFFLNLGDLDPNLSFTSSSATITVTAVPEASTIFLAIFGLGPVGIFRLRRFFFGEKLVNKTS